MLTLCSRFRLVPIVIASVFVIIGQVAWADDARPRRHALLIACSEFPFAPEVRPLPGASNDARHFDQLLRSEKYKFDDIRALIGWTDGGQSNPTFANIQAAFETLIADSHTGDQVFILMSGHGLQIATQPETKHRFGVAEEPDGLDEAFVAADYGPEPNVIRDDTLGNWLGRLKAKGTHTWIVFDCCHSGSLTRGQDDDEPRRLLTDDARQSQTTTRQSTYDTADTGVLDITNPDASPAATQGSLVALFAAQNYETTPEVTRPIGAASSAENRRGLLSFHLDYLLHNLFGKTTYRDLENGLANRYQAERGMNGPNPYFEGDMDRTVFGMETIERVSSLGLSLNAGKWTLSGGVMDGLTVGTVLSVRSGEELVGQVETVEVGLHSSEIHWTKDQSGIAGNTESLRSLSCLIEQQPINPWKVTINWLPLEHREGSPELAAAKTVQQWLQEQCALQTALVTTRAEGGASRWSLCVATPETARRRFGIEVPQTSVLLVNEAAAFRDDKQPDNKTKSDAIYAAYAIDDLNAAMKWLSTDFERLFRMQRIFQLAGLYGDSGPMLDTRGVSLNFAPLKSNDSGDDLQSGKKTLGRGTLRLGEEISVELASTRPFALWYTVLLVQSNGLVAPIQFASIPKGQSFKPTLREIEQIRLRPTQGNAAYIAVTVPMNDQRTPADFSYLAQLPIGVHVSGENSLSRGADGRDNAANSSTLVGLFQTTTRSGEMPIAIKQDGSQIAVRSWCVADQ